MVWSARYEPFGAVSLITGAAALNARFPGQWFQIEDGLAYNWHRTYDPTLGRYSQADPLGFVSGPSVYGYAGQSPQMRIDRLGLCVEDFCIVETAVAITIWDALGIGAGAAVTGAALSLTADNDNDCDRRIKAKNDAQSAYWNLTTKRIPSYLDSDTPDFGHYQAIIQKQNALRDAIRRVKLCCNPLPAELPEWEAATEEIEIRH